MSLAPGLVYCLNQNCKRPIFHDEKTCRFCGASQASYQAANPPADAGKVTTSALPAAARTPKAKMVNAWAEKKLHRVHPRYRKAVKAVVLCAFAYLAVTVPLRIYTMARIYSEWPGERVLFHPMMDTVPVFRNTRDSSVFMDSVGSFAGINGNGHWDGTDRAAMDELSVSRRVFYASPGSRVTVVDEYGSFLKVAFSNGVHAGDAGWVGKNCVFKPGESPDDAIRRAFETAGRKPQPPTDTRPRSMTSAEIEDLLAKAASSHHPR